MTTEAIGGKDMSLPERLKAAREARGWTVDQVAEQLRLPVRLVTLAEAGNLDALGAPIYRRGYLRSMARLLGVEDDELHAIAAVEPEPGLVATGVTPRSEYMIERYLRPATYIALTALIALPVVWWAASGQLGQELAAARSFDLQPPPVQVLVDGQVAAADGTGLPARLEPLLPGEPEAPPPLVRASMLSMPPVAAPAAAPPPEATPAPAGDAIGSGDHEAVLELTGDSWVEVTAVDGSRLHQALLGPGRWTFRSDGALAFKIGNSRAARLQANGADVDLATARSANDVARVQVFGSEG
jgi:cytoskeleton protein RodZ